MTPLSYHDHSPLHHRSLCLFSLREMTGLEARRSRADRRLVVITDEAGISGEGARATDSGETEEKIARPKKTHADTRASPRATHVNKARSPKVKSPRPLQIDTRAAHKKKNTTRAQPTPDTIAQTVSTLRPELFKSIQDQGSHVVDRAGSQSVDLGGTAGTSQGASGSYHSIASIGTAGSDSGASQQSQATTDQTGSTNNSQSSQSGQPFSGSVPGLSTLAKANSTSIHTLTLSSFGRSEHDSSFTQLSSILTDPPSSLADWDTNYIPD
jgi:hypothetical protein